jgi:hypothetical protein
VRSDKGGRAGVYVPVYACGRGRHATAEIGHLRKKRGTRACDDDASRVMKLGLLQSRHVRGFSVVSFILTCRQECF